MGIHAAVGARHLRLAELSQPSGLDCGSCWVARTPGASWAVSVLLALGWIWAWARAPDCLEVCKGFWSFKPREGDVEPCSCYWGQTLNEAFLVFGISDGASGLVPAIRAKHSMMHIWSFGISDGAWKDWSKLGEGWENPCCCCCWGQTSEASQAVLALWS